MTRRSPRPRTEAVPHAAGQRGQADDAVRGLRQIKDGATFYRDVIRELGGLDRLARERPWLFDFTRPTPLQGYAKNNDTPTPRPAPQRPHSIRNAQNPRHDPDRNLTGRYRGKTSLMSHNVNYVYFLTSFSLLAFPEGEGYCVRHEDRRTIDGFRSCRLPR